MTGEAIHFIRDDSGDELLVYPPNHGDPLPSIQIDVDDEERTSAMVSYTPAEAPALARAILTAAGLAEDPELPAARERVREFVRGWRLAGDHPATEVVELLADFARLAR